MKKQIQLFKTCCIPCLWLAAMLAADASVAAPETQPGSDVAGGIALIALVGVLLAVVTFVVKSLRRFDPEYNRKKPVNRDGFVEADHGVPYCDYEKTTEGFVVSYRRMPEYVSLLDTKTSRNAGCAVIVFVLFYKLPLLIIALIWAAWIASPTRIEVARDAVIINGKRYRRADFRGFGKYAPTQHEVTEDMQGHVRVESRCSLAFMYGTASQKLPGLWKNDHRVDEFLDALNQHLQAVPHAA